MSEFLSKTYISHFFNRSQITRKIFYTFLDLFLLRSWYLRREIKNWAKEKRDNVHILDVGSGFGQMVYYLNRTNQRWNILGLDNEKEQVCDCNSFFRKLRCNQVLFKSSILDNLSGTEAFDLILTCNTLQYVDDDQLVLQKFYDALKPDGELIISTDSRYSREIIHLDKNLHRKGYSKTEIKQKLSNCGFSRIKIRYSYGYLGSFSWQLSIKIPYRVLNFSKLFIILVPLYYLFVYPLCFVLNYMDSKMPHQNGLGLIVKAKK